MSLENILTYIDAEISKLVQVRTLLANTSNVSKKIANRTGINAALNGAFDTTKKRTLSPDARRRIADAQRKRWAAHRSMQSA